MTDKMLIEKIEMALCLAPGAIKTESRKPVYVEARWIASYFLYEKLHLTLKAIAICLGYSDHTMALYAIRKANDMIKQGDPSFFPKFHLISILYEQWQNK